METGQGQPPTHFHSISDSSYKTLGLKIAFRGDLTDMIWGVIAVFLQTLGGNSVSDLEQACVKALPPQVLSRRGSEIED